MPRTHFGFEQVLEEDKQNKVDEVFHSVAHRYDLMNDLMSVGLHRYWKYFALSLARVKSGDRVLDVAGGTGDVSLGLAKKVGVTGEVWLTDINVSMLSVGRDRLANEGVLTPMVQADAEKLPFPDYYFDRVCVSFGLRNMTHKDSALQEFYRILKPCGRLLVLEFSKIHPLFSKLYDVYSFKVLPKLGRWIAKDEDSYRYLAESIRVHPDQEGLKSMLEQVGFIGVDYYNLSAGVVALHIGIK